MDLYAREGKRGGAWMDGYKSRRRFADGTLQLPTAYLVCNFTPPVGDKEARLSHDEIITLFHETGHGLHHLLTQVDEVGVSGINGVEWDAVELPSQFMENFVWEYDVLAQMPRTKKPARYCRKSCSTKCTRPKTSSAVCSSSVKWNLPSSTWKSTIRKMKAV